jgi:hypothetical protein
MSYCLYASATDRVTILLALTLTIFIAIGRCYILQIYNRLSKIELRYR